MIGEGFEPKSGWDRKHMNVYEWVTRASLPASIPEEFELHLPDLSINGKLTKGLKINYSDMTKRVTYCPELM